MKAVDGGKKCVAVGSKTVAVGLEQVADDKNQKFLRCKANLAIGRRRRRPAEAIRLNPNWRGVRPYPGAAMSETGWPVNRRQTRVTEGVAAAGDGRTPHFEDAARRLAAVGAGGAGRKPETKGEGQAAEPNVEN